MHIYIQKDIYKGLLNMHWFRALCRLSFGPWSNMLLNGLNHRKAWSLKDESPSQHEGRQPRSGCQWSGLVLAVFMVPQLDERDKEEEARSLTFPQCSNPTIGVLASWPIYSPNSPSPNTITLVTGAAIWEFGKVFNTYIGDQSAYQYSRSTLSYDNGKSMDQ